MLSDAESFLLKQVRAKDADAWTQLVARFQGRLVAFAARRLANPTDAEDVAQETFLSLLQSLPTFRGDASLETHLFGLLRRRLADYYRKRGTSYHESLCALTDSLGNSPGVSPRETVDREQTASWYARRAEDDEEAFARLAGAVMTVVDQLRNELNFRDLMVAEATLYAQLRNKDVAPLLDINEQQVALIKHRLLKRVTQIVQYSEHDTPDALAEDLLSRVWETYRPSCPKRTTIGKYLLQTLDHDWQRYVGFHLRQLACRFCLANEDDLQRHEPDEPLNRRIFQSTVGFL